MDSIIRFVSVCQSEYSFDYTVRQFLAFKRHTLVDADVDFMIVTARRAHRNIEKYFLTERQLRYVSGEKSTIDIAKANFFKNEFTHITRERHFLSKVEYGETLRFGNRMLRRYFKYDAETQYGDCGALTSLVDCNSYSGHAVFGMHVAYNGREQMGYCAVISNEMIEEARKILGTIDDCIEEDLIALDVEHQSGDKLPFEVDGSFLPLYVLRRPINLSPKTSYFITSMFGKFGDYDCSPAPLGPVYRNGELVYPMENAVRPYASPVLNYDDFDFHQIAHVAFSKLTSSTNLVQEKRIFSFDEAVLGVPERKFRAIPRQTAAGFPYCYTVKSGKTEFFGDAQNYVLDTEQAMALRARVDGIICRAREGKRGAVIFNDFLKDEIRTHAKVEAVATRLISSAPLDYVIAWRMYFGDFSSYFMRKNIDTGMAPGICCYTDWSKLADHLSVKGSDVFAGDFKGFDSSEQPAIFQYILQYINQWYNDGEENARIREVLWADLEHSRHLGGKGNDQRHIYQWNKSLPSGHPFTTIVNSMYSLFLLVACYVRLTGDYTGFWDNVSPITYGDDNVVNVRKEIVDLYNQTTVAKTMMDSFGMIYTSDDKHSSLGTVKTIGEVTFLKRRFLLEGNRWLCPLELDSFLYCTYWCKNKRLQKKICQDELENCLEELSLHEERVWDDNALLIYSELSKRKVPAAPLSRTAYQRIVTARSDAWY